jgi:SAM-dependent methyltransferase
MSDVHNPRSYRDSWNTRYDQPAYVFGTEPNDFLAEMAEEIAAGPVLCLAEGEGRNAVFLALRGHAVTAVDQSAVGLAKASRLAEERGVTITPVVADLADYTIEPGEWSAIVSIFLHIPAALRRAIYRNAVVGLRPGGVFVLEAYTPKQIGLGTGGPQDPGLTPTLQQLQEDLDGLEFEIGRELQREVLEGIGHTGMAEVVQVFARKPSS